jgi:hypothetical protein
MTAHIVCTFRHPSNPAAVDRIAVEGNTWSHTPYATGRGRGHVMESHEAARAAAREKARRLVAATLTRALESMEAHLDPR